MIVSKDEARRILQGKKTTHRVPVKPGRDCPFVPGRDYAISTMADRDESELYGFTSPIVAIPGKVRRRRQRVPREVCRVMITEIAQGTLADVGVIQARAEGFHTSHEFYAAWCERHGIGPHDPTTQVWVLTFHRVRSADDRVRYMHRHSELGYTGDRRQALLGEDAEVIPEDVLEQYAKDACDRDDERRRAELNRRASLPIHVRLDLARAEAKARRIDIGNDELAIENRVRRLEARVIAANDQENAA